MSEAGVADSKTYEHGPLVARSSIMEEDEKIGILLISRVC